MVRSRRAALVALLALAALVPGCAAPEEAAPGVPPTGERDEGPRGLATTRSGNVTFANETRAAWLNFSMETIPRGATEEADIRLRLTAPNGTVMDDIAVPVEGGAAQVRYAFGDALDPGDELFPIAPGTWRWTVTSSVPISVSPTVHRSEGPAPLAGETGEVAEEY